ncbi:MAG: M48 family metalloprotease [Robiginitomaculum sp.]|nr:M48 family metalloprotease [Robiginitomaculum sp.]
MINKRAILLVFVFVLASCASPAKPNMHNTMAERLDRIAALLQNQATDKDTANAPIFLRQDDTPNASTDGQAVYITAGLMNSVSDLALALIIAHELGHISLGHYWSQSPLEQLEQEADRYGLFLLARAGLDYQEAVQLPIATQTPHEKVPHTHGQLPPNYGTNRAANFRLVIAEIEALKAKGVSITP